MKVKRDKKVMDGLESILKNLNLSAIEAYAKENHNNSSIEMKNERMIFSGIEFVNCHPDPLLSDVVKKAETPIAVINDWFCTLFRQHSIELMVQHDPRKEMKIFIDDGGNFIMENVYIFYKTEVSK